MNDLVYLDDDIVRVYEKGAKKSAKTLLATLFWGDQIKRVGQTGDNWIVEIPRNEWNETKKKYILKQYPGFIPKKAKFRTTPLLKVRYVDVGQGDASIVETPEGKFMLVDGGQDDHLRRYVTRAFSHLMAGKPLKCETIVVTHGDADHFSGLVRLLKPRSAGATAPLTVEQVFHNGLVKRTAKKESDAFGTTAIQNGETFVTDLAGDLRSVPDASMNKPFKEFKAVLGKLKKVNGKPPDVARLKYGDHKNVQVLSEANLKVEVLGPIATSVGGTDGLLFMKKPGSNSLSASHTINGNSVVLRLTYGNARFLFGADLNEQAQSMLVDKAATDNQDLHAEVFKVPHHGSADFSTRMLEAVRPVASVVSSGDENTSTEYIHPRAGLVGALGKYSRQNVEKPLIYVTETVAFFEKIGKADIYRYSTQTGKPSKKKETFINTYNKKSFGIVHVRTDGERILVATHSGKDDLKEAYVFTVDPSGIVGAMQQPSII
jgi:beta-lactamase superfamily II metal-dependent hydrolase